MDTRHWLTLRSGCAKSDLLTPYMPTAVAEAQTREASADYTEQTTWAMLCLLCNVSNSRALMLLLVVGALSRERVVVVPSTHPVYTSLPSPHHHASSPHSSHPISHLSHLHWQVWPIHGLDCSGSCHHWAAAIAVALVRGLSRRLIVPGQVFVHVIGQRHKRLRLNPLGEP